MENFAKSLKNHSWLLVFEGLLAVAFGVLAWVWPGLTVATLVILFGAYAIASGVMNFAAAFGAHKVGESPWPFLFRGALGVATGVIVAIWPDISALSLLYVVAFYAILIGTYELVAAIAMRKIIDNEWFLAIAGISSITFGVLAFIYPGDGAVALVWTIGIYAVVFGTSLIALGFRLHGFGRRLTSATA
jgi:uncharacterized membrane protein HdeD (DUF308 family)